MCVCVREREREREREIKKNERERVKHCCKKIESWYVKKSYIKMTHSTSIQNVVFMIYGTSINLIKSNLI